MYPDLKLMILYQVASNQSPSEDTGSTASYLPVQCCDLHIENTNSLLYRHCICMPYIYWAWVYCINIVSAHTMYRGKSEKVYCLQTKAVSLSDCPSLKVWTVCIRWIAYRKKLYNASCTRIKRSKKKGHITFSIILSGSV